MEHTIYIKIAKSCVCHRNQSELRSSARSFYCFNQQGWMAPLFWMFLFQFAYTTYLHFMSLNIYGCSVFVFANRRNIAEESPDAVCHLCTSCRSINCRRRGGWWPGGPLSWQGGAHPVTCNKPKPKETKWGAEWKTFNLWNADANSSCYLLC